MIQVITCIDFTGSNGVPRFPESLHYMSPGFMNQYQTAITSVCSILENYDYDKIITVYGFGGKPQFPDLFSTETSHFFPCSGDYQNPGIKGVDGVFQLYNYAIQNVELAGPTHFAPLLDEVIKYTQARSQQTQDNYTTCLILTDGTIHDMQESMDKIVVASTMPISIIIVGIGSADFTDMHKLDGDVVRVRDRWGNVARRDIVQFVEFSKFAGKPISSLAEEVLQELPGQVESYYQMIGKRPNPAVRVDTDSLLAVRQNVGVPLLANLLNSFPR